MREYIYCLQVIHFVFTILQDFFNTEHEAYITDQRLVVLSNMSEDI